MTEQRSTLLVAGLGLLHSTIGFVQHGGRDLSAPGITMLGTALFAFFPAIYLSLAPYPGTPMEMLPLAVNICFLGQLFSHELIWRPKERRRSLAPATIERRPAQWARRWGALLVSAGLLAALAGIHNQFVEAATFSGLVLYAVASFGCQQHRTALGAYLGSGAAFLGYVTLVFTGFGRLTIGSLGIALLMAFAHRWRGRSVKLGVLFIAAPVLEYLAARRVAFTATLNPNQGSNVTGLESVIGPFLRFCELLQMSLQGQGPDAKGMTYLATLTVPVPRAWWSGKPVGFGADLAHLFRPDLDGTGHSELALIHGEWVYNFGVVSLPVLLLVFACFVQWLDRFRVERLSMPLTTRRQVVVLAGAVVLIAGLVDLVWGGTFTYVARAGARLLVLAVVCAPLLLAEAVGRKPARPASYRS